MGLTTSVIICTHNPKRENLIRAIEALKKQKMSIDRWDLVVIDNRSDDIVSSWLDLTWHPTGRHVREEELGLTAARLRGIRETSGDLIIFVDDDNVLDSDYLTQAIAIGEQVEHIGAWGGTIAPEFEVVPAAWTKGLWHYLAVRDIREDVWSNDPDAGNAIPCGAGLCIRRRVAERYAAEIEANAVRKKLGRKGSSLISSEDFDMVLTSRFYNLGWGCFERLKMVHILPKERLDKDYLLKLVESVSLSNTVLRAQIGRQVEQPHSWGRLAITAIRIGLRSGQTSAEVYLARQRALRKVPYFSRDESGLGPRSHN